MSSSAGGARRESRARASAAEPSPIEGFLDAYINAFETFEASAVADLFNYPCQITSDAADAPVTTIPSRKAWVGQVKQLLDAYRAIGVRSAEVLDTEVIQLTPRLAQASVRWSLLDQVGARVYVFDASYTLLEVGQGMRIAAIAHNETARLRAALEQRALPESRASLRARSGLTPP